MIQGAIQAGVVAAVDVIGCDPYEKSRADFEKATGAKAAADGADLAASCETILLATKPLDVTTALADAAKSATGAPRLVISIAAGVTLGALEAAAGENLRLIREMANTPAVVG